jgi:hypothetical protein
MSCDSKREPWQVTATSTTDNDCRKKMNHGLEIIMKKKHVILLSLALFLRSTKEATERLHSLYINLCQPFVAHSP